MLIGFGLGVVSLLVVIGLIIMVRSILKTRRNTKELVEVNRRIDEVYQLIEERQRMNDDSLQHAYTQIDDNDKEIRSIIDSKFDKFETKIKASQDKNK